MIKDVNEVEIVNLVNKKEVYKKYMMEKIREEDWHGVMDISADLRELEVELRIRQEKLK